PVAPAGLEGGDGLTCAGRLARLAAGLRRMSAAAAPSAAAAKPTPCAPPAVVDAHAGDLRHQVTLVGLHLEAVDEAIAVGVEHMEEALRVGAEFGQGHCSVVVGVGAGEPGPEAVGAAERLAHRADEEAHARSRRRRGFTAVGLDDRRILRLGRRGARQAKEHCGQEKPSNHSWKILYAPSELGRIAAAEMRRMRVGCETLPTEAASGSSAGNDQGRRSCSPSSSYARSSERWAYGFRRCW